MIIVNKLTKKYSTDFELDIKELHIENGERLALVGANGSGKSTLLKLLDGVIIPDKGEIIRNCDIINDIYYQPQAPFLLDSTVYDNIYLGFGGKKRGICAERRREIVYAAAEKCKLTKLLKKRAYTLSGGEKQRMYFSRLLLKKRKLIMLDEPFSALDVEISRKMEDILLSYCCESDSSLILCTHIPSQAMRLCDKMIIMNNGKIAENGLTSDIISEPKTDWGKQFISQWRVN